MLQHRTWTGNQRY